MGVHLHLTANAVLREIGPRIARHPLAHALRALVFAEAALFALVRCLSVDARTSLQMHQNNESIKPLGIQYKTSTVSHTHQWTITNEMRIREAQMAHVALRHTVFVDAFNAFHDR